MQVHGRGPRPPVQAERWYTPAMATIYEAKNGTRFAPMPGRVLVRPDEGPQHVGGVFLPDAVRRFEGFRSGEVLAVGDPEIDGQPVDVPAVGDFVHYDRNYKPPRQDQGVTLGEEMLVLLWADAVLCVEERVA